MLQGGRSALPPSRGCIQAHRCEALLLPAANDWHNLVIGVAPHAEAAERPAGLGVGWVRAAARPGRAGERRVGGTTSRPGQGCAAPAAPCAPAAQLRHHLQARRGRLRKRGSPQRRWGPAAAQHRCLGPEAVAACQSELHGCVWRLQRAGLAARDAARPPLQARPADTRDAGTWCRSAAGSMSSQSHRVAQRRSDLAARPLGGPQAVTPPPPPPPRPRPPCSWTAAPAPRTTPLPAA